MESLDLSDILDYEDYMVTSSDEELPGMGRSALLTLNSGLLEHLLKKNSDSNVNKLHI